MSYAIAAVAGVSLVYGIYANEKAEGARRDAEYEADKEKRRLEQLETDQKARNEATTLRDKLKMQRLSNQDLSASKTSATPIFGNSIGSYSGKTLIGG